jgi:hypothetical protein
MVDTLARDLGCMCARLGPDLSFGPWVGRRMNKGEKQKRTRTWTTLSPMLLRCNFLRMPDSSTRMLLKRSMHQDVQAAVTSTPSARCDCLLSEHPETTACTWVEKQGTMPTDRMHNNSNQQHG